MGFAGSMIQGVGNAVINEVAKGGSVGQLNLGNSGQSNSNSWMNTLASKALPSDTNINSNSVSGATINNNSNSLSATNNMNNKIGNSTGLALSNPAGISSMNNTSNMNREAYSGLTDYAQYLN